MVRRISRSDQAPAAEDACEKAFDTKITREEINRRNSAGMRRDISIKPEDFVMPDVPDRPARPGSDQE